MIFYRVILVAAAFTAIAASSYCQNNEWDVIVIGAGPSGIVAADRISEAGKKTLLLEQGGPSYYITGGRARPDWLSGTNLSRVDVPGLYKSIFSTQDDLTCPREYLNSFSGCTLGGCTAINAGLFFQPPASDWDTYFPEGWKNEDMQFAINKTREKQPFTSTPSKDGVMYLQSGYKTAKRWLVDGAGYDEIKLNEQPDRKTKVFGHPEFNYKGGQRSGPVKTYLQSALRRSNFSLRTGVHALRVARNGSTATGVVAVSNNTETTFSLCSSNHSRIVLSAGALASPQLLMHSGIGPSQILTNLATSGHLMMSSADWINNTAIGDKLFDNPNTFIELSSPSIQSYVYNYSYPPDADRKLYLDQRSGPYSFASQTSAFWDVIQQGNETVGVQGTIDSAGYEDYMSNNTITLNVYGTSGLRSFGRVILDANGVAGASPNFLYSDPRDAQAIATFIHNIFAALPSDVTPLNVAKNSTLEELTTWVSTWSKYTRGNVLHWSSSLRFGTAVDGFARVKGMNNLHVLDASILAPLTTNPVMGTMIAAERGVERILEL